MAYCKFFRGTVPPGARFDPFGPDVEMGGDHRQRRFREYESIYNPDIRCHDWFKLIKQHFLCRPGPDHLNPPGFEDDMFMWNGTRQMHDITGYNLAFYYSSTIWIIL